VQPHLLRDKGSVRLRRVLFEGGMDLSNDSSNEQFIAIENLAWTIRQVSESNGAEETTEDQSDALLHNQPTANRDLSRTVKTPSIECIIIHHDQYFSFGNASKTNPAWKMAIKTMKGIIQKGDSFLSSLVDPSSATEALPVFAVADVSFWVLRDFGTCLMKRTNELSVGAACVDATEMHPEHKRVIKTLGRAIENFMKRNHFWPSGSHGQAHQLKKVNVVVFLYSNMDDSFDMVTLESRQVDGASHETGKYCRRSRNH